MDTNEDQFEEMGFLPEGEEPPADESDEDPPDELSREFVSKLVDKVMEFLVVLVGHDLHPYQKPLARRIMESVIINDGEEITALASRQSGKSETVADVMSTLMVLLPRLARMYPDLLGKFKDGLWVGMFAPVESQVETLFGRTVSRLTSERANEVLGDPEIDDITARTPGVTKGLRLKKSGSTLLMMTANPRAKIESKSFHIIVIDECQEADDFVVAKSISPMGAYYNATIVKTGTPTTSKNNFYRAIQLNKRRATGRNARQNHFQWDWRDVAKCNPNYAKFIKKEMLRIGEDSDEFQMSYCVAPETRILTADLRYIPADTVEVGMKLVGFDEERPGKGLHRRFRESEVLDVTRILRPTYRVTLDDGTTVECSAEHRWLVTTAGRRTQWKATRDLTATDSIFKVADVWEADRSYEAGFLSAAFDGEGCLIRRPDGRITGLSFAQKSNAMLEQTRRFLEESGFSWWSADRDDDECQVTGLGGGQASTLRFLGQMRPPRLLNKFRVSSLGSIGRHDHRATDFSHPRVFELEYLGEQELVAVKTTTKTYVAEGLASHNCCKWLLERGMFVTQTVMDELGDTSQEVVKVWHRSPVVVGIDPARKMDSTVVTVVWVDWDRPDEFGYFDHRILNWLEIQGDDWEEQYYQIVNFLANYDVLAVGVDSQGVGDAVAQRLKLLLRGAEVIPVGSMNSEQSKRWKHLQALIQRRMIGWPSHAKTRRTRVWKRFSQQMTDAEIQYSGPNFLVAAPDEAHAHDDYVDSLAIACSLTQDLVMPTVEVADNPFFVRG